MKLPFSKMGGFKKENNGVFHLTIKKHALNAQIKRFQ